MYEPYINHTGGSRSRAIEPLSPMPRILIAIPVCHKLDYTRWESSESPTFDKSIAWEGRAYGTDIHISGENDRIQALRDTWLQDIQLFSSHVDYKLFYGTPHNREPLPDEVFMGCPDDYAHLPLKTFGICRYAVEHDYDFLFKADDDTAVYVDRIIHELMSHRMDYGGYTNGRVATGGTGYWLSRRAFTIVADKGSQSHWAEDVSVSKILFHNNIQAVHLEGHHTGREHHWFYPNGFDPSIEMAGISSFHAVRPADMRAWYAHKKGNK